MQNNHPSNSIAIIGGGLVGALWASYLAMKRHSVEIYERLPDMRQQSVSAGRSVNLALSLRGLTALDEIGLKELVLKDSVEMRGRMLHPRQKGSPLTFQPYSENKDHLICSISRSDLNKRLLTRAEESERVKIYFNKEISSCDWDPHLKLRFTDGTSIQPEIVFATDGANSRVRQSLLEKQSLQSKTVMQDYGYKELAILPGDHGSFRMEKNALHIWPRQSFMLIALPNHDGSFTCTLFLPFEGKESFATLQTAQDVENFFTAEFPDTLALLPNLTEDFAKNPIGRFGTVTTSPWHYQDKVLLLGDAAHGIVPFFGQGMNAGFEDCRLLNSLWDSQNRSKILKEFSANRKIDTDAIAELALENFIEMRDLTGNPQFLLEKAIERKLEKSFPQKYRSRYSLVTFSNAPYSLALKVGVRQQKILQKLSVGLNDVDHLDLKKAEYLIDEQLRDVWQEVSSFL